MAYYPVSIGHEVCVALGMKGVRDFSIHFELNRVAYVKAEILLTKEQADKLCTVLKRYELREKPLPLP